MNDHADLVTTLAPGIQSPPLASDGAAPRKLPGRLGRPLLWAVWLIGWSATALGYLWVHDADLSSALYDAFPLAAAAAILIGLRRYRPPQPGPWRLVAASMVALALGDVVYTWLDLQGGITFPSLADVAYLSGYSLLSLGVFLLFRRSGGGRGALIDTAVFVVAGGLVLWTLVVAPSLDPTADPVALVVALAYPAMDLLLLALIARLLMSSAGRPTSFNLIAVALAIFLASDLVYAFQSLTDSYVGGAIDLGWIGGYALWGAAALHPSMRDGIRQAAQPAALTHRRLALLAATAFIGPTLLALQGGLIASVDPMPVVALSGVMFLLIVARLAGIVRSQRLLLEERGRLHETLRRQAVEDPLTDLPNRRGFLDAVSDAVASDPLHTAVLFLDLDDFKIVNDAHGHATGDALLKVVGQRLLRVIREEDSVGRLGGDEFAVLFRACPSEQAAIGLAQRLLAAIGTAATILGQTVQPAASIGIAIGGPGATGDSLLRDADLAMYRAKALGKGRCELFRAELYDDALRAVSIRQDLPRALEEGQLEVYFQPIMSMETGEIESLEALLRWHHPRLGLVAPAEFIGLAEGSGAIVPIGRWVLQQACAAAAAWQHSGSPATGINVNLSPAQLLSPDIILDVRAALDDSGLTPSLLTLELTEIAIDDPRFAAERLNVFRKWGVRISIDDFGTGFSSLSRVGGLPVQELKIDRSLIDHVDGRMAAAVIQLGQTLGLRLVAEGVETSEQLDRMRALGCDAVQGFLLGRPVRQSMVAGLIEAHRVPVTAAGVRKPKAAALPA
jgi:diguanylate cyclase